MIRENSVLSSLNSQQIQVWFENRRFLEEKKKDAFVFNLLNEKVGAIGRVLLLESDFLHREVQQLLREKACIRKLLQYASLESFLALEVPRSVFKNVKMVGTRRVLLLHNEYLHKEVQQLHREKEYIQNLLENESSSEFEFNSYRSWSRAADSSKGSCLLSGIIAKFPLKAPIELNRVSVPRMKFFGGLREISLNNCSDLSNFLVNGIIIDVSVMLRFVKATIISDGSLNFLRKHQEFILCCSVKDIKPVLQRSQELSSVVPAFLLQGFRIVMGRYCVVGAWSYLPNEQAALGNVKLI
ncbi:hypothetical protein POM88_007225 [Heracleum sosnowskyi]|uniref:Homeobox domain-containing protein n=1 Tax=Heracleum sosnowskyi TaxID=360622 RepID=A0AAD8J7H4_9APIA|nr:hypothetical protein POM88_007225 [Heracleum sosnowskyi]